MRNIRDNRRKRSGIWTSRDGRDLQPGQTGTDPATIRGIPGDRAQLQEEEEDIIWLPGNFIQTSTGIQVDITTSWCCCVLMINIIQVAHPLPRATLPTTPTDR